MTFISSMVSAPSLLIKRVAFQASMASNIANPMAAECSQTAMSPVSASVNSISNNRNATSRRCGPVKEGSSSMTWVKLTVENG